MKKISFMRNQQAGFTFLELSFVLIVLGMIASLMAQVVPAMRRASATAETVRNLTSVEFSLQSFAAINGRLPCADSDGDGFENGSGASCAVVGKLPFATLGYSAPLMNADGYDFKYGLYNNPGNNTPAGTALLGSNTDRYRPAVGKGTPVTLQSDRRTGTSGRLDFCQGLRAGMDLTFDDRYLHVQTNGNKKHVAYVLVDPGVGNMDLAGDMFDGLNGAATSALPRFEHPNLKQSVMYDDRVVVAYFDQMWEALGCSANMATAGRAHPNIETTLALIKQSMVDYRTQLDISVDSAFADNFSAGAGIASATSGLLTAGASMSTDVASAINTLGATSGAAVSAGIAIALNTAALVVATTNQVYTVLNYNDFKRFRNDFDTLVSTKLNPLYESVKADVDRSGSLVFSDQ